ncbi:MAG TPA: permease prefix domain 2-containing transporter [Terriglobales bacterium]|nr:permease prefix domain 2-containing transporter [Terriglobales bacterium]
MTSPAEFVQPPRLARWLVALFNSAGKADSIAGDLQEEFSQLTSSSGLASARSWYWRQAIKTAPHLAAMDFREAPWSTAAAILGGFLLCRFVYWLPNQLLGALTDKYLTYWSTHFKAYMLLATDGMFIAHLLASLLVGSIVAFAAKGREMIATSILGLILVALGLVASIIWLVRTGDLWMSLLLCADALAMVVGGMLLRMHRAHAAESIAKS